MTAALTPVPKIQFFANDGTPLVGGKLYSYAAGSTTPLATYTTYAGTVANTNPVILDSRGEANVWLGAGPYKLALYDSVNALIWTVDNITPVSDASLVSYLPAGTGAVVTTVQAKLRESVSVKDFGAKGDESTNDYAAIVLALAAGAGKRIIFPAGTYVINYTPPTCFTLPANVVLEGEGDGLTVLRFTASSTTLGVLFTQTSANATLKNLTVQIVEVAGGQTSMLNWSANNLLLDNCTFIGGMTNTGSTLNSNTYGIIFPTTATTQTDLVVQNCSFSGFAYPFLKSNTSLSIQKRIKIVNSDFFGNYREDISLNSPLGSITGVLISGNSVHDPAGPGASVSYQLGIALASVSEAVIQGNSVIGQFGAGTGVIHLEENCVDVAIVGNNILTQGSTGTGIQLSSNNISGTLYAPQFVTIEANTVAFSGTALSSTSRGIYVVYNSTLDPKNLSIVGNTIKNFEFGFITQDTPVENVVFTSNVIDSCTNGIQTGEGGMQVRGNTTSNCATGIVLVSAPGNNSVVVDHNFVACTANISVGASGSILMLMNPAFTFPLQSPSAGTNTYLVLTAANANDRAYGSMLISASVPTIVSDVVSRSDLVLWDGATFTNTNQVSYQPGSITVTPARNSTNFVLNFFSTNARTNARIQARLNGMISVRG
jgi:hypothetical protein